jgi:hypothetical protein
METLKCTDVEFPVNMKFEIIDLVIWVMAVLLSPVNFIPVGAG